MVRQPIFVGTGEGPPSSGAEKGRSYAPPHECNYRVFQVRDKTLACATLASDPRRCRSNLAAPSETQAFLRGRTKRLGVVP
jgi:hypothetical protein